MMAEPDAAVAPLRNDGVAMPDAADLAAIRHAMRLLAARRLTHSTTCATCAQPLTHVMRTRRYCSPACRQRAVRQRARARRALERSWADGTWTLAVLRDALGLAP